MAEPSARRISSTSTDEKQGWAPNEQDLSTLPTTALDDSAADASASDPFAPYPENSQGWVVVLGCSLISVATVGLGLAWGVFQQYYSRHVLVGTPSWVLSMIGGLLGTLMTVLSIFTGKLGDQYGYKPFIAFGSIVWVISLVGTAFSTKLWHFIICQGVLQGISAGLVFPMIMSLPSQWFLRRRSLATGVVLAGSSLGGAFSSTIIRIMLNHLGLRRTMLIKAAIDAVTLLVGYALIRERQVQGRKAYGPDGKRAKIVWIDRSFVTDPVFWSISLCMLLCTFGYLTPIFFSEVYTSQKLPHLNSVLAVLPLTIMNIASGIGRMSVGHAADLLGVMNVFFLSVLISGLSQVLLWTFVTTYSGIMIFSVIYGLVSGCYLSLATPAAAQIYGNRRLAGLSGMFFIFIAPGELAGAPVSAAILSSTNSWAAVTGFAGGIQILAAACLLFARFRGERKVFAKY